MLKSLIASTVLALALSPMARADAPMAFDVAEDHTRIFMADAPLHENGMSAHGNAFVSQGYIYPAGTLDAGSTGVNEDGSPAYPDLVLGTWTCDGYFVGEGANATSGVWVISRKVFDFADGGMIVTQGTEIVDTGVENLRPITGATGDYAGIEGGMIQTLLGFSEKMTVNVTFRLQEDASDEAYIRPRDASLTQGGKTSDASGRGDPRIDQDDHLEWDSGEPAGPVF